KLEKHMNQKKQQDILDQLEVGTVRAAYLKDGTWQANKKVKEAILAVFAAGKNKAYDDAYKGFVDKDNLPPQQFSSEQNIRLVPGGSSVRRGAHVAEGVIIM